MARSASMVRLASFATLTMTLVFFVAAVLSKGMTEEVFLEAGIFLVSVKLVLGQLETNQKLREILEHVDAVKRAERRTDQS